MMSSPLFQNTFTLRSPGVVNFAEIIKIATKFMKTKADFWRKNADVSRPQGVCDVFHTFSESSLGEHKCDKFHHCRISDFAPPPIREQPPKCPSKTRFFF